VPFLIDHRQDVNLLILKSRDDSPKTIGRPNRAEISIHHLFNIQETGNPQSKIKVYGNQYTNNTLNQRKRQAMDSGTTPGMTNRTASVMLGLSQYPKYDSSFGFRVKPGMTGCGFRDKPGMTERWIATSLRSSQ
jgi:hypothetical protein